MKNEAMPFSFPYLEATDIMCRVARVTSKGVMLLLYKDARVDMRFLDACVGAGNWQREHVEIKGNLYCRVGVRFVREDGSADWVWKSDCGVESNTEGEKGEASDSFKRACFNWGIGRELYTAPFIWIPADGVQIKDGKTFDRFRVEKLRIEDGVITGLAIVNESLGKRVFVWTKGEADAK